MFKRHNKDSTTSTAKSPPFSATKWIRLFAPDLITMALMGALGLGIYEAPPAPSRSFPVFFQDGQVVYPEFAYPLRHEIVPIYAAALIAFFAPFFFFCLFQSRRRSVYDLLATTMGLLKSLITGAVFQVWIKWLIGGLRPHFYAVCQPNIPQGQAPSGNGFAALMYDRSVCTGDPKQINDALESFPSGHSTAAFAGLIYLALYLNAQLKVMSAHNSQYWKMILLFCPVLGAVLIAGALTVDKYHNWYDVVAGGIIGTAVSLVAFRSTFASVWDFRFNHIVLPRTTSAFHRQPWLDGPHNAPYFGYQVPVDAHPSSLPFTREGGWGSGQEAYAGAPFDATSMLSMGGSGGAGNALNGGRRDVGPDGVGYAGRPGIV
ncbi:acid phosphatase/Vanadium-dependent haloperoxidase [Pterulicium gracile]|uniref:Acid phosphatase/Vanadium-dependent haloperoxidase n=1 Tax=Pterulicium gracile TaxID=1884261 RepID=A0A5C3R6M4_9AGAR|nr:acid phosphatase/Vanadium-dependent haloperoxidase [Pterula gracilis]